MSVETKEKVEKALSQLQSQLSTSFVFIVQEMILPEDEENTEDIELPYFLIKRSERDKDDKNIFLLYFSEEDLCNLPLIEIKRHLLHEIIHCIQWELMDEADYMISHIKNKKLAAELEKRFSHATENSVYRLERTFGPFILPKAKWDKP